MFTLGTLNCTVEMQSCALKAVSKITNPPAPYTVMGIIMCNLSLLLVLSTIPSKEFNERSLFLGLCAYIPLDEPRHKDYYHGEGEDSARCRADQLPSLGIHSQSQSLPHRYPGSQNDVTEGSAHAQRTCMGQASYAYGRRICSQVHRM